MLCDALELSPENDLPILRHQKLRPKPLLLRIPLPISCVLDHAALAAVEPPSSFRDVSGDHIDGLGQRDTACHAK